MDNNEQNNVNNTEPAADGCNPGTESVETEGKDNESSESKYFFAEVNTENKEPYSYSPAPVVEKKRGISPSVFAVSLIFTVIVTFMITCLYVSNYKDKVFSASHGR